MKKILLFGILALTVGCGQSVSSPNGIKPTKAPTVIPATVTLSQTVAVSDSQIKGGSSYQIMQRGGRGGGAIGGRGFGGRGFGGRGIGGRFGGRFGRFNNRFFGFGGLNYPIYDYAGSYYPDYFEPYSYGAGAYTSLYSTPLYNYPSFAAPYGNYNLPYLSGCCGGGFQGAAIYDNIMPPIDALRMGYVPSTLVRTPNAAAAATAVEEAPQAMELKH